MALIQIETSMLTSESAGEFLMGNNTTIFTSMVEESDLVLSMQMNSMGADAVQYLYTINMAIVCAFVCLVGITTNIINIVVFIRMEFKETINIALLGLSISDVFSLVSLLWQCICYNPLFMYAENVTFFTLQIQQKTGGWVNMIFTRTSALITMYITFERCLCIVIPMTIRRILTPKRVFWIIFSIYCIVLGSLASNFFNFSLAAKPIPGTNRTKIGVVYNDNRFWTQLVSYNLSAFYAVLTFVGVISCTAILVQKLNERGLWLKTATSGTDQDKAKNAKENQIIKMVVSLAIIFIVGLTPSVVLLLAAAAIPDLNMGRKYQNLFIICISVANTFGAVNASVNLFVYNMMSSKFHQIMQSMLTFKSREGQTQQQ